uniref:Uncharacterized protein n=1 Tax=Mucochytrium quahogii TaxID=96639 RepID=A0A7S2R678_9STRA|mmetsp:Transcript_324/g.601  ORF Transcript_324/g.601 Transcript_324/m.601 type:complete len:195 (-) Transcript_324:271-855(-)|eukprot:CAMPEP_0203784226 /NCGR_PEP_ID=MMETSP0100_2-20121128/348_1 /ASSEMBLY_ACC=CAM_ASM_000210 /TAXON_ID=96639 /ORGANISM=" , Strain NY0313808BC1" /LENGTH=194 /DNA_ID=CAMNT_0050686183 /DNA_START=127 /DNA_END=711 /DNA_ORIENTATION=-
MLARGKEDSCPTKISRKEAVSRHRAMVAKMKPNMFSEERFQYLDGISKAAVGDFGRGVPAKNLGFILQVEEEKGLEYTIIKQKKKATKAPLKVEEIENILRGVFGERIKAAGANKPKRISAWAEENTENELKTSNPSGECASTLNISKSDQDVLEESMCDSGETFGGRLAVDLDSPRKLKPAVFDNFCDFSECN